MLTIDRASLLSGLDPLQARVPLAKLRWETARVIRAYQLFKHVEIFDPLIGGGSPEQRALAKIMKNECAAASEAYWDYARRWSSEDIVGQRDAYRQAQRDMGDRLRSHVAKERASIALLLSGAASTRTGTGRATGA